MPTLDSALLKQFTEEIFQACGAPKHEAVLIAEQLVTANLLGYDTHGVIRIPQYLEEVQQGVIVPGAPAQLERETETTAVVNCGWNFGQVGARRAVEIAVEKARSRHVSTVVARCCNHAGRLGAYTQYAAEQGMLALAFCNSPSHGHFVLPWGGTQARLATNPLSFACPGNSNAPILADFSTAVASEGAIRLHRNQGRPVPAGWIVDADGAPTQDPAEFYGPPRGAILPFGDSRGYRGYALSLLVEIMGGLLGGSSTVEDQPGNGLAFIVIDVGAFLPPDDFLALAHEMRDYIKSSPPAEGHQEVMLPGEPDFHKREQRLREGIQIDETSWEQICTAARSRGVEFRVHT